MTTDHDDRNLSAIVLRPIQLADADRVHEWASHERACRFQSWGPNAREETDAFVAEAARTWEQPDGPRLVWAASSAHRVVGMGELKRTPPPVRRSRTPYTSPSGDSDTEPRSLVCS